jgi:hypothetical protein
MLRLSSTRCRSWLSRALLRLTPAPPPALHVQVYVEEKLELRARSDPVAFASKDEASVRRSVRGEALSEWNTMLRDRQDREYYVGKAEGAAPNPATTGSDRSAPAPTGLCRQSS